MECGGSEDARVFVTPALPEIFFLHSLSGNEPTSTPKRGLPLLIIAKHRSAMPHRSVNRHFHIFAPTGHPPGSSEI
jgi:hypothetical protein